MLRRVMLSVGMFVADNTDGTSGDAQPVFAMSGDSHSEDVTIPSVFLFQKEGTIVKAYAKQSTAVHGMNLIVRLGGKAEAIRKSYLIKLLTTSTPSLGASHL